MDRLDALALFCRVVETGSFSEAAREAGLGQPQASRAVAALEERYGARLLQRSTRRLSLTEAGARVYEQARELVQQHEGLEAALKGVDQAPVGLLRVTASVAFARAELVPHAPAFLQAFPHVKLDFHTADHRVDLVAEGVDLAFRLGEMDDSGLTAKRLGAYPRVLVASRGYLERMGAPARPQDLPAHRCVVFTTTRHRARWPLRRGRESVQADVDGDVSAASGRVISDLIRLGLGIAMVPTFLVRKGLEDGSLQRVLPEWEGPPVPLHAVWARRDLPRKARAFLDFVGQRLTAER